MAKYMGKFGRHNRDMLKGNQIRFSVDLSLYFKTFGNHFVLSTYRSLGFFRGVTKGAEKNCLTQ